MYTPPFNAVTDEDEIRAMVAAARIALVVTAGPDDVPDATTLPILWRGDTVIAHFAKANPHWRQIREGMPALLVVSGPDAYVSPSWYASKYEHGKVVPTWNYSAVHLSGTARVHEDAEWLRAAVTDLTHAHEDDRATPWRVADAPAAYIDGQLRGIVGLEVTVTRVEGKAKWSQNRSEADRRGVIDGLRAEPFAGAAFVAGAMRSTLSAGDS